MVRRLRGIALGLAVVLTAGGTALGLPAGPAIVLAQPLLVDLSLPPQGDAAGAALTTVDVPPELPAVLDADPIIVAANSAVDALAPEDWEVDALAATLGGDPDAPFTFVRDSTRFDPYAGVLRGAEGTLAARGGNSWDRALLLLALLRSDGQTARLAEGTLDATTAERVLATAFADPTTPLPDAGPYGIDVPVITAVDGRATRDLALLEPAYLPFLDPTGIVDDRDPAVADIARHAWVQVERDGAWLDLDPTLADAQPGETVTTATSTHDEAPLDAVVGVSVRLLAETLVNGALSTTAVLDERLDAATAADQQLLLYFGPSSGGGGGLLSAGGPDVVIPALSVGGTSTLGTEFIVSASEGGGLLGGSTDTDLVSLTLEVESPTGGGEPAIARQVLLDRAPADARAAGTITRDVLAPPAGSVELPTQLRGVRHLLVSTGGVSPRVTNIQRAWGAWTSATEASDPAALAASSVEHAYWATGIADQELVVGSELAVVPGVDDDQVRAFIAQPRVYLVTLGADPADPTRVSGTTDLLLDRVRVLAREGAPADAAARHRAWYGVLQSALETEHGLAAAAALDPAALEVIGASLGITEAPLAVVAPGTDGDLPEGTPPTLAAAVAGGSAVLVSGDPAGARAWWEVEGDGTVRAVLAPSLGGIGRVGGPRPPGVPRVTPPQQLPNKPPNPPRVPVKPTTPRPAPQPAPAKPDCRGNEQVILQRCVSFFAQLTVGQMLLTVVLGVVAVSALVVLGMLVAGA